MSVRNRDLAWGDDVRYLTDDRDQERLELVIFPGNNGDWYVGIVPEGEGYAGRCVRLCTSGGASHFAPGLTTGIAQAYRALLDASKKGT